MSATAVALAAGSATFAFGAALTAGSTAVGSGFAAVLACDANGFSESYTTSGGVVTAVTVGGIADPGCEGGSLELTLTDATGGAIASAGPQVVPTDADTLDNAVTLSVSPQPAAAQVAGIRVSIVGP